MKMTFKSFLAGFVACSLLLSSFTCVLAEEPLQENNATAQIQEDVDSTATLPNQPESVNEQVNQPEKEPENNPDQSNDILDESDSQPDETETLDNSEKSENNDGLSSGSITKKVVEENTEELSSASDIVPAQLLVPATPIADEFEVEDTNIKSNVEYNTDGKENPDIWGVKTVDWYVPGTSNSNKLGDLKVTNVFPKSTLYFPLGKKMSTLLELSNGRFVSLLDLEFDDIDDPFKFDVKKVDKLGIIKEIDIITEKKVKGKLERTCYLKISLNDYKDTTKCNTTGTITLTARKDCSDRNCHESTFCEDDKIEFNYSITVSNKLVHNGDKVNLGDRICMQPTANKLNTLTWSDTRAQIQFTPDSETPFYLYLTTRLNYTRYPVHNIKGDDLWFYDFVDNQKIPFSSPATLILGKPWGTGQQSPALDSVYIYQVNNNYQLVNVTENFKYTEAKDGLIEGWTTT